MPIVATRLGSLLRVQDGAQCSAPSAGTRTISLRYKKGRKAREPDFYRDLKLIQDCYFPGRGLLHKVAPRGLEGDDVIAQLAVNAVTSLEAIPSSADAEVNLIRGENRELSLLMQAGGGRAGAGDTSPSQLGTSGGLYSYGGSCSSSSAPAPEQPLQSPTSLPPDLHPVVVSTDKDLIQLMKYGVHIYDPWTSNRKAPDPLSEDVEKLLAGFRTPTDIKQKFGVPADWLAEYLSLVGDSADGLAGVKGLGPKGARKLFSEFEAGREAYESDHEEILVSVKVQRGSGISEGGSASGTGSGIISEDKIAPEVLAKLPHNTDASAREAFFRLLDDDSAVERAKLGKLLDDDGRAVAKETFEV